MPTKTQRILANLPGTFLPDARASALGAVADAFGGELLAAENALAAILRAHWVDHADRGAPRIDDLRRIASLYGLAPRPDEGVEEFREHLKRYVLTFLEGTVTVQGLLRVTAEALGLRLLDGYDELDTWWTGPDPDAPLVATEGVGTDAAERVLGAASLAVQGAAAQPARVTGVVDLGDGVDLRSASTLRLRLDGGSTLEVDLAAGAADPARVTLAEVVAAIDGAVGSAVASAADGALALESPTAGAESRIELLAGPGDAAPAVLGFAARSLRGTAAEPARLTGRSDLPGEIDLSERRYLRLGIDGTLLAEVDCAGPDPVATTLDQVRDAINSALGAAVASHDGRFLTLTSPTAGFAGQILLLDAAAQDARSRLFGDAGGSALGRDAQPARLVGRADLSAGVDLSSASRLRLRVDGGEPVTVDLAGADPSATGIEEIAATLDAATSAVVSHDGRFLTVTSPTAGPSSRVTVQKLASGDAAEAVLGIRSRVFEGSDAAPAQVVGAELPDPLNLWASHRLRIAVDGGEPVTVDLAAGAADRADVQPEELAAAINTALDAPSDGPPGEEGGGVAHADGRRLVLRSTVPGAASSLRILPIERRRSRRFVTRAILEDEAALPLFGFVSAEGRGSEATAASIRGAPSLVRGIDLSRDRHLRVEVDDVPAFEVDCAGPRPRATTLDEIVARIDEAASAAVGSTIAAPDGGRLRLTSPTHGAGGSLRLLSSRAADALDTLGLSAGTTRGRAAGGVRLVGTTDLSTGVDLPAGSALRIGIDGGPPVEIPLAPDGDEHYALPRLVTAVSFALGAQVASSESGRLVLASPSEGAAAALEIAEPDGVDATPALLGVSSPRTYRGEDAAPARVAGTIELPAALDLSVRRHLRAGADGSVAEIDLAAEADDPAAVTPAEVVEAIAGAEGTGGLLAAIEEGRPVLTSPTAGFGGRVTLEPSTVGDARSALFGDAPVEARGEDPKPAAIEGAVPLLSTVDLGARRWLRLAVDGGPPFEVDVAGAAPEHTLADEVVTALDAASPGLASVTADDRLRLVSPTAGPGSRIALLPRRSLELEEYPPTPVHAERAGRHAASIELRNAGAAPAEVRAEVDARRGGFGFSLTDLATGTGVRVSAAVAAGERLRIRRTEGGSIDAGVVARDGGERTVEAAAVTAFGERPLELPRGTVRLLFRECRVSRFDEARFDSGRFAGGICTEWGVFGASRFAASPDREAGDARFPVPVFAPSDLPTEPTVELTFDWLGHLPGRFRVHLPADLPESFGGRLGEARFGGRGPEVHAGVVTEPPDDPDQVIARINTGSGGAGEGETATGAGTPSALVHVPPEEGEEEPGLVPRVPLGWEPQLMPFREPRYLTLGNPDRAARLYLGEPGVDGFVRLDARAAGAWGNGIAVTARQAGPGRYDLTVFYAGARFENARRAALGDPLPSAAAQILLPGAVGVLQAKAAGVEAQVDRDQALGTGHEDPIDPSRSTDRASTDKEP